MRTAGETTRPSLRALVPLVVGPVLLAGCSGTEKLELGASAQLEAEEPLAAELAVLSATPSTLADTGLEGIFGTQVSGEPWLVGYRIDLTSGTREDFSWDAVNDLSSSAWVADLGRTEVQASIVNGVGPDDLPCAEQGTEVVEPVLMYGCQVFLVPRGESIESITVTDVATWAVED